MHQSRIHSGFARLTVIFMLALASIWLMSPQTVIADGSTPLYSPLEGCYDIASYGVGLYVDGAGSLTVNSPGAVVAAYIEWVGVEDTTPAGDGTSQLTINGEAVDGVLASGSAGRATRPDPDWWSWHANIGPTAGDPNDRLVTTVGATTLNISGWDNSNDKTNGATVTIIYETGTCKYPHRLEALTGVDWYYYGNSGEEFTELLVYDIVPRPIERVATIHLTHAGTDATQTSCRGGAIWMVAGAGSAPGATDYDILARDGSGRGYGINGGVEVANDPFTAPSLPCTPAVNPAPDSSYQAGHPCPGGAATCPYRAVELRPGTGGDVGAEWGVVELDVVIPANTSWVAFQLESEKDQNGESGSWAGGASFVIPIPDIEVVKEANVNVAQVGDTVIYTYTVTNVGDTALSTVMAVDDHLGAVSLADTTLDIGESTQGTLSYVVQESDLPGPLTNIVVATGQPPTGDPVSSSDDETVELAAIGLVKEVGTPLAEIGDTVTYTYTITNNGGVTLTNVSLVDDKLGAISLDGGITVIQQASGGQGIVSVEAESYDEKVAGTASGGNHWVGVTLPGGYSGSGALQAQPNDGDQINTGYAPDNSPRLDFQVNFVETGTHYVWVRGHGNGSNSDDSVHAGLDGAAVATADRITFNAASSYVWTRATMDGPDAALDVPSAGIHTLNLWMREDGVIIDKIVLTTDAGYDPTAAGVYGPAESSRGVLLASGDTLIVSQSYTIQQSDAPGPIVNIATVTGEPPEGPDVEDTDTQTVNLLARLSGTVYDDTASPNGVYDGDEAPLAGVEITLSDGANTWTEYTNAQGYYEFTGLAPAHYTISEQDPANYASTGDVDPPNDNTIEVNLPSGGNVTERDFFDATLGSIGNFVWRDLDLDGLQDPGEPGIDGVLMALYTGACPASGSPVMETTGSGGLYTFNNLGPGSYCVQVAASNFAPTGVLAGFGHTSAATFGPSPQTVNLAAGQSYLLADFGYARASLDLLKSVDNVVVVSGTLVTYSYTFTNTGDTSLDDLVVTDNRLGQICPPPAAPALLPGESYTCSKTAELTQSVCNVGQVTATAVDSKGTILDGFDLVLAGSDEVCVDVVDARLTLTPPEASNEVGDDHVFTALLEIDYGDGSGFVAAPAGETIDFAIASGPGSLDSASCQTSASGQCSVTLSSSATGTTQVSASWNGAISTGLGTTAASAGDDALKHWLDARIRISPLQATNPVGEAHTFTVTVEAEQGNGWVAAPDGSTVTFSFVSNTANAFFVGGIDTCTTAAGQCTVTINANQNGTVVVHAAATFTIQGVTLTRETDGLGENSGDATKVYVGGKIGNYVWEDANSNGVQDEPAAAGVNGVRVELYTSSGLFVDFRVTANDGSGDPGYYLFENVTPGSYYVKFIKPSGYEFTQPDVDDGNADPDERDSDADRSTGQTATIAVGGNTVDLTWDAGIYRPVTLGDQTWIDTNGNAIPDDGELLLNTVLVQITGPAGSLPLVTTGGALFAPDDNYLVTNLPPGTYIVTVVSWPSGYVPTGPTTITQTLLPGETNLTFDFPFINTTGTAVVSFQALRWHGTMTLQWITASEEGNDGFSVWRASSASGPWILASTSLIPSRAAGNGGASYQWTDTTIQPGVIYWYQLRADPGGQIIGPVQAAFGARLFLPFTSR